MTESSSVLLETLRQYPRGISPVVPIRETVVEEAGRHGLPGFVRTALKQARGSLPERVDDALRQQGRWVAAHVSKVKHLTHSVLEVLAAHKVPVAPLKGYALASRLYPEPLHRFTSDVDVLVAPKHLEHAERALVALGLRREDAVAEAFARRHHHHLVFSSTRGTVELHFRLTAAFGTTLGAEPLLARAAPASLDGRPMLQLDPSDEILYLATHATQSHFARLTWLFDLKLLGAQGRVDWDAVIVRAQEHQLASPAGLALELARRFLNADIPEDLVDALQVSRWHLAALQRFWTPQRVLRTGASVHPWMETLALCAASDDLSGGVRFLSELGARAAKRKVATTLPAFVPERWRA